MAKFPRVAAVKTITDKALADAKVAGSVPVGKISADITTAQTFDPATGKYTRDDRASESTLGNLVGNALLDALKASRPAGPRSASSIPADSAATCCTRTQASRTAWSATPTPTRCCRS